MDLIKLQRQLKLHEGEKRFPFVDTVGKITIGTGRNLTDKGISQATINQMFSEDVTDTVNFLNSHLSWWTSLDDVRQRALVDMTFDLMGKVLDFKKMLTALQVKDWPTAATELLNSTFAAQTGQRARDLAAQFRTGLDV